MTSCELEVVQWLHALGNDVCPWDIDAIGHELDDVDEVGRLGYVAPDIVEWLYAHGGVLRSPM